MLHDLLRLLGLLDGTQLITQPRRVLEALRFGRRLHVAAKRTHHVAVPALEQQHRLAEMLLVDGTIDGEHAGPEAALDLVLDARAAAVLEHRIAARAEREHLADRVERIADRRRTGERAEVPAAVLHDLPRHEYPGPRILHAHLHAHVALVVLQADVVARPVLLDQVVLEDQRFLVVRRDERLELRHALDEKADLAALVATTNVAADPAPQVRGLADVDDLPVAILQQIDAGTRWDRRQTLLESASVRRDGDGHRRRGLVLRAHDPRL